MRAARDHEPQPLAAAGIRERGHDEVGAERSVLDDLADPAVDLGRVVRSRDDVGGLAVGDVVGVTQRPDVDEGDRAAVQVLHHLLVGPRGVLLDPPVAAGPAGGGERLHRLDADLAGAAVSPSRPSLESKRSSAAAAR